MGPHYYILPGLGADERVFANLILPENHIHLHWIENKPNESLKSYAARMAEEIKHEKVVLIGLSFGGIVAQEIAAIRKVERLILICTVKSRPELPWYFRLAGLLRIIDLLPKIIFTKPNKLVAYAFSLIRKQDKEILESCFKNMSTEHLIWASDKILNWRGVKHNNPSYHIASKGDRIFTSNKKKADVLVDGGHFAIYTHSKTMQLALDKALL